MARVRQGSGPMVSVVSLMAGAAEDTVSVLEAPDEVPSSSLGDAVSVPRHVSGDAVVR